MRGYDEQFVAQGVHMIFDGYVGPKWEEYEGVKKSRLVFIGENLSRKFLEKEFLSCCALE